MAKKLKKSTHTKTKTVAANSGSVHHVFGGCPTYFKAWCTAVKSRAVRGGYRGVGHQFAAKLGECCPDSLNPKEWAKEITKLEALFKKAVSGQSLDSAVEWCQKTFPKVLAQIPTASHSKFVEGIKDRWHEAGKRFEW